MRRVPGLTEQFNVYVDGGQRLLGLAEVTLPSLEALTETIKGAGLMGELEIVSLGQFSALTFTMSFRSLLDDPLDYVIGKPYNFDLRSAQTFEDIGTFDKGVAAERYSIRGPVKTINPGKRAPHSAWDSVGPGFKSLKVHIKPDKYNVCRDWYFNTF